MIQKIKDLFYSIFDEEEEIYDMKEKRRTERINEMVKRIESNDYEKCPCCDGKGTKNVELFNPDSQDYCFACDGTGYWKVIK